MDFQLKGNVTPRWRHISRGFRVDFDSVYRFSGPESSFLTFLGRFDHSLGSKSTKNRRKNGFLPRWAVSYIFFEHDRMRVVSTWLDQPFLRYREKTLNYEKKIFISSRFGIYSRFISVKVPWNSRAVQGIHLVALVTRSDTWFSRKWAKKESKLTKKKGPRPHFFSSFLV